MREELRWGIIGAGSIAEAFANGLAGSYTGKLEAIGSRSLEKAQTFAGRFKANKAYGSYDALVADDAVQVVYVATPHPVHAEWAIAAAEAGKHILCEKPAGINHAEGMAMIEAAIRNDVFFMEAFMYRCHPQIEKVVELIRDSAIGKVCLIQASFAYNAGTGTDGRVFEAELGGGGIMDVGCYPVSFARLVAGVALDRDFADPIDVSAAGHLGVTGVDDYACATLKFEEDIFAQVSTGVRLGTDCCARIYGIKGSIILPTPWTPGGRFDSTKAEVVLNTREPQTFTFETKQTIFCLEADKVAQYLDERQAAPPAMTWNDTLGNLKTLDAWRAALNLKFPMELLANMNQPISKRPLVRREQVVPKVTIDGLDKDVARLVLGCDKSDPRMLHALCDGYFEIGGNVFDTARVYGNSEMILGKWIESRGVRGEVVVFTKGAHTPFCDPENLTKELTESLEKLRTDCVDIYMVHRDNLEIPVGEFVDVLNEHVQAGRIRIFGGSNWTSARVDAANEYAASKGLQGFTAISNNFSLARMMNPPWDGCLASSEDEFRQWHERTQMPILPWASQAQGFFVTSDGVIDPEYRSMVGKCWDSEENFERRRRAFELAAKKGVTGLNISLAYVLCQPFPAFPLVGPKTLEQLRTLLPALDVSLSMDELVWLDVRDK